MLTTDETLAELQRLEKSGADIHGLDGFRLRPDGSFDSPIDLILDFRTATGPVGEPVQRYVEARQFVMANATAQIRWEIVSGSAQA